MCRIYGFSNFFDSDFRQGDFKCGPIRRYLSRRRGRDELVVDFRSSGGHLAEGACPPESLHSQPEVQVLLAEL